MRKPLALLALLGAAAAFWRKKQAGKAEKDLWTEATSTPDLR